MEVVDRSPTSFTFISLPGHFEGENRYITFTFHKEGVDPFAHMQMDADAWGPWTYGAWFSLETGQAEAFWREFANNVGAAYA